MSSKLVGKISGDLGGKVPDATPEGGHVKKEPEVAVLKVSSELIAPTT